LTQPSPRAARRRRITSELQPAALFCEQSAASLHHILPSCAQAEREGRVGSSFPGRKKAGVHAGKCMGSSGGEV